MATCREIVNSALRKLGKLGAGREARVADAEDALESLKSLYRGWIDSGAFGRLIDVVPITDYVAGFNQRVYRNSEDVTSITLPDLVDRCGTALPPRDLTAVVIIDQIDAKTTSYIFDGSVKAWQQIDALVIDDPAPLSHRNRDGLAACLAVAIADEYGEVPGLSTAPRAASFQSSLLHRYSGPRDTVPGIWM